MKVFVKKIEEGEETAVIRCREITAQIRQAVSVLERSSRRIVAKSRGEQVFVNQHDILYFESVDEKVFVYTSDLQLPTNYTLSELQELLKEEGFFRCSKSFIVNLDKIVSLKSEMGNRIDAKLDNGEHLIISRRYAKELRAVLGEGRT